MVAGESPRCRRFRAAYRVVIPPGRTTQAQTDVTIAAPAYAPNPRAIGSPASPEVYRMEDTPEKIGKMVKATFTGTGSKKIMLIAHMDTVYQVGMGAKQPFRIDGDKAYGLGIADDRFKAFMAQVGGDYARPADGTDL